jgi:hypothetical protein
MYPTTSKDEPADALDEGANGLAEAIAFDFGGKRAPAPAASGRAAAWGRWLRIPMVTRESVDEIALGAPRRVARLAH